jgi:FKBP-type peptidyl-prolyl cis-trans isomerase
MHLWLHRLVPFALLSLAGPGHAQTPSPARASAELPLAAYGDIGYALGQSGKFARLNWTEAQFEAFLSGLREAYYRKPREPSPTAEVLNDRTHQRLQQVEQEDTRAFNDYLKDPDHLEAYMKGMCTRMHLERSDSGLAFGVQNMSGSVRPQPEDNVVVTWGVRTADMKSEIEVLGVTRMKLKVSDLLPGLVEGVQMMTPGSAAMLVLPPDLSFGSGQWPPGVDRGVPLVYMVKLEQVLPAQ